MQNTRRKLLFCVALFFLVPCLAYSSTDASQYENKISVENGIKHFDRGEARYFEGIPLIKLEGSNYDMGLQYGVLLKKELNQMAAEMNAFKDDVTASYPFILRPFVPFVINSLLNGMKARIPYYYLDEIRGMSEGSGVDFNTLLFLAVGGGLMDTSACTAMLVKLDDRIIHGRNFDWEPPSIGKYPVIVKYCPTGKKSFTSFSFIGFPGVVHAVNDDKLSLTLNIAAYMFKKDNTGMPMIYQTREILENATNLKTAGDIIRKNKSDEPGWMITICSANETDGAIFEIFDNNITETHIKGKYEYVHNVLFQPELVEDLELSKKYNEVFLGQTYWNLARHYTSERIIKEKGINSVDDMLDYLRNADFYKYKNVYSNYAATINNELTVNTLIFDLKNDVVYFAFAQSYSAFARMYQYNFKNRTLVLFKEADQRIEAPELTTKMNWYYNYKKLRYRGEFKKIQEQTDFSSDLGPSQLKYIIEAWREKPSVKPDILISSIDRQIAKYPDFGMLYLLKADVLKESGKDNDAVASYEQALATPYLSNQFRLEILSKLAKINEKGNPDLARIQMQQYCSLIDELRKIHHIDSKHEKDYMKFKKKL